MKFGRRFLQRQHLAWAASYVQYDQVKVILKLVLKASDDHARNHEIAKLSAVLQDYLPRFIAFYDELLAKITEKGEPLRSNHRVLSSALAQPHAKRLYDLGRNELNEALQAVASQRSRILEAREFEHLNQAALERILEKLGRVSYSFAGSNLAPLIEGIERVQSALQARRLHLQDMLSRIGGTQYVLELLYGSKASDYFSQPGPSELITTFNSSEATGGQPLIFAAKLQNQKQVQSLLDQRTDVNSVEQHTNRTALWYACNFGNRKLVDLLLQAGAKPSLEDALEWSPQERAAYHGHESIVLALKSLTAKAPPTSTLVFHKDYGLTRSTVHYLEHGLTHVVVNIGPLHNADESIPLEFEPRSAASDEILTLEVSAIKASGQTREIPLPILEDLTNDPCIFSTHRLEQMSLKFSLYKSVKRSTDLLGSALVLVSSLADFTGGKLENVARSHVVAIQSKKDAGYIGKLTFTALVVQPYKGLSPTQPTPWNFGSGIGGHRGLGQNKKSWTFLQEGENTIESFREAQRLGAAFVEFDVQVTKDGVPVIYHDFLVSETGLSAPMHLLDHDQFSFISEIQRPNNASGKPRLRRSQSAGADSQVPLDEFKARMSRTLEYRMNSFKPNTRGAFVHEPFTTLEDMFSKLDPSLPFDVEIKYPMFSETLDWQIEPYFPEINYFLDTILEKFHKCAGTRSIFFSSFSPEVCIAMSLKQKEYPVYFLNDGRAPTGDSRAASLYEAVRFARRWRLAGIVLESTPFVECPRLVKYVKSFDLATATYGGLNNQPEAVQIQFDAGVDGIVVDKVHLITQTCRRR